MAITAELLEQKLRHDLRHHLADRLSRDDKFVRELYQGLTNRVWRRKGHDDGDVHIALSWERAEELVDDVLKELGKAPVALAQTGGEGTLTDDVEQELGGRGWVSEPLDTSRHDDQHLGSPEDQPVTPPQDTLREGHQAAEEELRRRIEQ
jgi:hypothetical protein